jgi:hypothetical protein
VSCYKECGDELVLLAVIQQSAEKRLRRSQIIIDPDAKKDQLRRSDICLRTLALFGCMALDAAPNGADPCRIRIYKDLVATGDRLADN